MIELYDINARLQAGPVQIDIYDLNSPRRHLGEVRLSLNDDPANYDGEVSGLVKDALRDYLAARPGTLLFLERGGCNLGPFQSLRPALEAWLADLRAERP